MTSRTQRWHFLHRAQDSLRRAGEASDPAIAAVHREFYLLYLKRADEGLDPDVQPATVESDQERVLAVPTQVGWRFGEDAG